MNHKKRILVTGAAGFIGMHVSKRLALEGFDVIGLDNVNTYYDTDLKYDRLKELGIPKESILYNNLSSGIDGFRFIELNLTDSGNLMALFSKQRFEIVINLAAQAGVRYSITNPRDYIESNIIGFFNLLETCRNFPVEHLLFASSSSVYGNSDNVPFQTNHVTDQPVSLYAASKKSNEILAYTYSHLYGIPSTGLRFFTVYGPWGRPDMAYFIFTKSLFEQKPIHLFNSGKLKRDFTYIDDIVESIVRLIPIVPESQNQQVAYRILNIGNQQPVEVIQFVSILEKLTDKKAILVEKPMQQGDVYITYADTSEIEALTGFRPLTPLETGLSHFMKWYRNYFKI